VRPTQITRRKKQLLELAPSVFDGKHTRTEASVDVDALYKKFGRLEIERGFLASRPGASSHQRRDGWWSWSYPFSPSANCAISRAPPTTTSQRALL